MEEAHQFLRQLRADAPISAVETALNTAADAVSRMQQLPSLYSALLQVLTDRVAPYIAENFAPATSALVAHFDAIFLHGPPAPAFIALTDALRIGAAAGDVLARTALLFAGAQTGGRRRLAAVLSNAPHDGAPPAATAAALAHLPTRIANAVCDAATTGNATVDLLDDAAHARTLAEAMLDLPDVRDDARDELVSALLRALVALNKEPHLASAWAEHGDPARAARLALIAPEMCSPALLRAFLEVEKRGAFAVHASAAVLVGSATARSAARHELPLLHPLLRRPTVSAKRLVRAVLKAGGREAAEHGLAEVATVWGGERFARDADFRRQRQATRVLLLYLRVLGGAARKAEDGIMLTLARGVTARLDHGDLRIRRFGMVVGESFSRRCGDAKPLTFHRGGVREDAGLDREEDCDGDSDFSDLANNDAYDCFAADGDEAVWASRSHDGVAGAEDTIVYSKGNGGRNRAPNGHTQKRKPENSARRKWDGDEEDDGVPEEWEMEDDWESLDGFSLSSESDGDELENRLRASRLDYEEVRKKVSAPMSVSRILGLLRSVNSGEDVPLLQESRLVCATLRTIAARAREGVVNDALYLSASEMCRAVLLVEAGRFPPEDEKLISAARSDALAALSQLDIATVGTMLISGVIVSANADRSRRSEALSLLADAARAVSERNFFTTATSTVKSEAPTAADADTAGTVTRRLERSLAAKQAQKKSDAEASPALNALTLCAGRLFFLLANGVTGAVDATALVSLAERDAGIFAQSLATLASLVSLCGPGCAERGEMALALAEIGATASGHADASVRRAAALAAGAAAGATTAADLATDSGRSGLVLPVNVDDGGGGDLVQWLGQAAENDGDVLVRRFAGLALRKWQRVIADVASGE